MDIKEAILNSLQKEGILQILTINDFNNFGFFGKTVYVALLYV